MISLLCGFELVIYKEFSKDSLYQELLKRWNKRRASEMTDLFTEDGNLVGFDGSQINGRSEARSVLSQIFANHQTAAYLGIVKEVRLLSPDVAILRAVAGMVPPGQSEINPPSPLMFYDGYTRSFLTRFLIPGSKTKLI